MKKLLLILTLSLAMTSTPKIKAAPTAGVIVATCIAATLAILDCKFKVGPPAKPTKENPKPITPKQCKTAELILNGTLELIALGSIFYLAYKASKKRATS